MRIHFAFPWNFLTKYVLIYSSRPGMLNDRVTTAAFRPGALKKIHEISAVVNCCCLIARRIEPTSVRIIFTLGLRQSHWIIALALAKISKSTPTSAYLYWYTFQLRDDQFLADEIRAKRTTDPHVVSIKPNKFKNSSRVYILLHSWAQVYELNNKPAFPNPYTIELIIISSV